VCGPNRLRHPCFQSPPVERGRRRSVAVARSGPLALLGSLHPRNKLVFPGLARGGNLAHVGFGPICVPAEAAPCFRFHCDTNQRPVQAICAVGSTEQRVGIVCQSGPSVIGQRGFMCGYDRLGSRSVDWKKVRGASGKAPMLAKTFLYHVAAKCWPLYGAAQLRHGPSPPRLMIRFSLVSRELSRLHRPR